MSENDAKEKSPIEASWAPADPRDRLYDTSATGSEKTASIFRVIAAFHPVLNLPVLIYDSFRKFGVVRGFFLWGVVLGLLAVFAWFLGK